MRRLLFAAALSLLACGPTIVDATHYNQTCISVTDCVPVFSGDVCQPCGCANAAINAKDKARYDTAVKNETALCRGQPAVLCGPCPQPTATCDAQVCVFVAGP
jgi:hypothetical protein